MENEAIDYGTYSIDELRDVALRNNPGAIQTNAINELYERAQRASQDNIRAPQLQKQLNNLLAKIKAYNNKQCSTEQRFNDVSNERRYDPRPPTQPLSGNIKTNEEIRDLALQPAADQSQRKKAIYDLHARAKDDTAIQLEKDIQVAETKLKALKTPYPNMENLMNANGAEWMEATQQSGYTSDEVMANDDGHYSSLLNTSTGGAPLPK